MPMELNIKRIAENEVDTLFGFITALAIHEGEDQFLTVTPEELRNSGFGPNPKWSGFFAVIDGKPMGYATYTHDFHLWSGRPRITLDDLFVVAECRGRGAGEALMRAVFEVATETSAQVSWTVRPENKKAISFYKGLGAKYREIGKCFWTPPI